MSARGPGAGAALVAALGAAFGAGACEDATGVTAHGSVRVRATRDSLRVSNGSAAPVFTFASGRSRLALIDWAPCADAARCPPIPPGATRAESRDRIEAGRGETEAVVYWWHAGARVDGVVRPDSIRAVVVRLP